MNTQQRKLRALVPAPVRLALLKHYSRPYRAKTLRGYDGIAALDEEMAKLGYEVMDTGIEKVAVYGGQGHVIKLGLRAEREAECFNLTPRSRTLAPTALLMPGVVVQERGLILAHIGYDHPDHARLFDGPWQGSLVDRFKRQCRNLDLHDEHDHNIALMPSGQLRMIDFAIDAPSYIRRHSTPRKVA